MKKFAIFSRGQESGWRGKDFECFAEAEHENELNLGLHKECTCECKCGECENHEDEDGMCMHFECECEIWAVEVAMDVVEYCWYDDKFYTQQELDVKEVKDAVDKESRAGTDLSRAELDLKELQKKIESLKEELKSATEARHEVYEKYEENYGPIEGRAEHFNKKVREK